MGDAGLDQLSMHAYKKDLLQNKESVAQGGEWVTHIRKLQLKDREDFLQLGLVRMARVRSSAKADVMELRTTCCTQILSFVRAPT